MAGGDDRGLEHSWTLSAVTVAYQPGLATHRIVFFFLPSRYPPPQRAVVGKRWTYRDTPEIGFMCKRFVQTRMGTILRGENLSPKKTRLFLAI